MSIAEPDRLFIRVKLASLCKWLVFCHDALDVTFVTNVSVKAVKPRRGRMRAGVLL